MRHDHYLRPLVTDRRPRRMVVFDTETHRVPMDGFRGERHYFAVGCCASMAEGPDGWSVTPQPASYSAEDLWERITRLAAPRGETRVWAHNLQYDLSVSRAWAILRGLGWSCGAGDFAITDESCWAVWRRGERRLVLSDSTSFLAGAGLDLIAADLGEARPPLPDGYRLGLDELRRRCDRDVGILAEAIRDLVAWLDEEGAGSLSRTGPGQAMNHYRRRFLQRGDVLCHSDEAALVREREAMAAGRCEAWRWGPVAGAVDEWDFQLAYPTIAAEESLPLRYSHALADVSDAEVARLRRRGYQVCGRAWIETPDPVVPCRLPDESLAWPVGAFYASLWDCEADLVSEAGGRVQWREAAAYRASDALQPWARWVIDQAQGGAPSPLLGRVAKSWARTMVGRFALRYAEWELFADVAGVDRFTADDVALIDGTDGVDDSAYLWLGGQVFQRAGLVESDSSAPAITSRIAAVSRVRLWRAIQAAGLAEVAYCDTDSLLVSPRGSAALRRAEIPGLRLKDRYRDVVIYGVRQLLLGDRARASGLPRGARRAGGERWEAEVWERWAEGPGRAGSVTVTARGFTMRQSDGRRARLAGGGTEAVRYVIEQSAADERAA